METTIAERQAHCTRIYDAWHERARAGDVDGLRALSTPDATLETRMSWG